MGRAPCCDKVGLNKGTWSAEEDAKLISFVLKHGHHNWRSLPKLAGLLRCGKSCRLRWFNYLRPDIKRGHFTEQEEDTIIKLHSLLGNKWSKIAACLPGRTDNEIKNVWNTHLKKRAQQQPASSNSAVAAADQAALSDSVAALVLEIPSESSIDDLLNYMPSTSASAEAHRPEYSSPCSSSSTTTTSSKRVNNLSSASMPEDAPGALLELDPVWKFLEEMEEFEVAGRDQMGGGAGDGSEKDYWLDYLEKELGLDDAAAAAATAVEEEEGDRDPVSSYFQAKSSIFFPY